MQAYGTEKSSQRGPFIITVATNEVDFRKTTIQKLRSLIGARCGISRNAIDNLRLVYAGKELEYRRTFEDYNIQRNSAIQFWLRYR